MDTYDARGRRLDEPDEPSRHWHATDAEHRVTGDAWRQADLPTMLRMMREDWGTRRVTIRPCWGLGRCP